jgi:hypothetical protein
MRKSTLTALALMSGTSILAAPAYAQNQASETGKASDVVVYEKEFIQQFNAVDAYQAIQRIPGFAFDAGSADVRGLSEAAGNVVINGQRPGTKSLTLAAVLQRIPASRIARIEIGPGNRFSTEYASRSQVANIILNKTGGIAGSVEASLARTYNGRLYPEGNGSVSLKSGISTITAALSFENHQFDQEGYDRISTLPENDLVELRVKKNKVSEPILTGSLVWDIEKSENTKFHINGSVTRVKSELDQKNFVYPARGPDRDDLLFSDYRTNSWEISADGTFPVLDGSFHLTTVASRHKEDDLDLISFRINSVFDGGIGQTLDGVQDERVVRASWSKSIMGFEIETGLEGVYNRLSSVVDLYDVNIDGTTSHIPQSIERAVISERRGEAFFNIVKPLAKNVRLTAGLAYEASTIKVRGDAQSSKDLSFIKPKAAVEWKPGRWMFQVSVKRNVSQLDFYDFLSKANLNSDVENGGNADLVPQTSWDFVFTAERGIFADGRIRLELEHDIISNLVDRIPVGKGMDAPGNLASGKASYARLQVDIPLTFAGLKNTRFIASARGANTSVRDPYTLANRPISAIWPFKADAGIKYDGKSMAWGVDVAYKNYMTTFRVDEIDRQVSINPFVSAYVEWRPRPKSSIRLSVDNLLDRPAWRKRTFYDTDRSSPDPSLYEERYRNQHIVPYLTAKTQF